MQRVNHVEPLNGDEKRKLGLLSKPIPWRFHHSVDLDPNEELEACETWEGVKTSDSQASEPAGLYDPRRPPSSEP